MTIPTILAVIVTAGGLLFVARPFFRHPQQQTAAHADTFAQERLQLAEERDRALAALKELEFDHRTGKISDSDYRALIGPLRQHAVETLRSLEPAVRTASIAAQGPTRRADEAEGERRSAAR